MESKEIKWDFYRKLYEIDNNNPVHERVCPKLTINHINVCNAMKMRVFLATQVCL